MPANKNIIAQLPKVLSDENIAAAAVASAMQESNITLHPKEQKRLPFLQPPRANQRLWKVQQMYTCWLKLPPKYQSLSIALGSI